LDDTHKRESVTSWNSMWNDMWVIAYLLRCRPWFKIKR
jgi:hypothetical protein